MNRNPTLRHPALAAALVLLLALCARADLAPGDQVQLSLRGVDPAEQVKVNGTYRVGESGAVRLPMLARVVQAKGFNAEQFARRVEAAYRDEGIYARPAVEIEAVNIQDQGAEAIFSVGGQVRRAGQSPYRKGMTVIQAIDAAGGRNDFGGRNLILLREGRQFCLDFHQLAHKNIELKPGDSLQVEQKGVIDRWKGSEERIRELMP